LPDFPCPNIPRWEKYTKRQLYQAAISYAKWLLIFPNGHKMCEHFSFQGPPKFTQFGIFGLKTNRLATLVRKPVGGLATFATSASLDWQKAKGRKFSAEKK
jgi:hypothetical protein